MGAFLSSGTDSFAIVKAMCDLGSKPDKVYSVGFKNNEFDELPFSKLAAKALGVPIDATIFRADELSCKAPLEHLVDPFADSSCLAVYLLCCVAAKTHKVVLSGDGADELLAGYPTYGAHRYAKTYRLLPKPIREKLISPLLTYIPDKGGKYTWSETPNRFAHGASKGKWLDHASWRVIFPERSKTTFYNPWMRDKVKDNNPLKSYVLKMQEAESAGQHPLDCMLYADLVHYLPSDMLLKVDKMSMAHGLEVRVPFLDHEFVEWCWRLPVHLKRQNGVGKRVLRASIENSYPKELSQRPKSGFNVLIPDFKPEMNHLHKILTPNKLEKFSGWGQYHRFIARFAVQVLNQWASQAFD